MNSNPTSAPEPKTERAEQIVANLKKLQKGHLVALKRSFGVTLPESKTVAKQAFYKVYYGYGRRRQVDERDLTWLFVAMGAIATQEYKNFIESAGSIDSNQATKPTEPTKATQDAASTEPQKPARSGESMGRALQNYATASEQKDFVERKLMQLMDLSIRQEPELFASKLARIIKLLHNKGVRFSSQQLILDLQGWDSPRRHVQQRWISDFYQAEVPADSPEDVAPSTESSELTVSSNAGGM